MNVLVLYASTHGHTKRIAERVGHVLRDADHTVTVRDVAQSPGLEASHYDMVVVGASIHNGHYQAQIVDWARGHAEALGSRPSAFFSVCLAVADDTDESRTAAAGYLASFEEETGWTPRQRTTFAGAIQYREYDFWTRLVIRTMMRQGHHPTDTSRDFDYTDWDAVDAWARDLATGLGKPQPV